jgi:hypothetical protein
VLVALALSAVELRQQRRHEAAAPQEAPVPD